MSLDHQLNYITYTLSNGIRLIHKEVDSPVSHIGLIVNAGSRNELLHEHGLAHYIEHAMFKGTHKRKSFQIISRLEDVGGELNAYTTKEETCVHASFLNDDYERAIELIGDIFFNASFPEKEIEKEKDIIIDEINSYKDNPSELIFDDFEHMIFPDVALGRPILGTPETVNSFSPKHILDYKLRNYNTSQIVLSSVGNIKFDKLLKLFKKYYEPIQLRSHQQECEQNIVYCSNNKNIDYDTYQSHCIIGNVAYNLHDERRLSLFLLNNILGGPGMNSRLNMSLREKNGFTYNIESNYNPYADTGVFTVYFGTDKEKIEKSIQLAHVEFKKLRDSKLGSIQLSKAKKQLIGQLAISSENNEAFMLNMGKSFLNFGKVESLLEIYQQIEAINSSQLLDIANEILDPKKLSTLIYK